MRAVGIFAAIVLGLPVLSQDVNLRTDRTPASPAWPFGPPRTRVHLEGVAMRSDGETLSIELPDQRVVRIRLDQATRYNPAASPAVIASFRVADFVGVEAEVSGNGLLEARSVSFMRPPSENEAAEVLQSPELSQPWHRNELAGAAQPPEAELRLAAIPKPDAIGSYAPEGGETDRCGPRKSATLTQSTMR